MNYKRHKTKLHWIILCHKGCGWKDNANVPARWSVNTRRSVGYNTDIRKEVEAYNDESNQMEQIRMVRTQL